MKDGKNLIYSFDSYELDPAESRLLRDGEVVPLPPKAFQTLVVLVENNGHLVDKETLINEVWTDSFVEEGNLKICVHTLRNALAGSKFIETVPKKGYRFNAPVKLVERPGNNFLVEKQTVSSITFEATRIDDDARYLLAGRRSLASSIKQPRFLVPAILVAMLATLGAWYFASDRSIKNPLIASPLAGVKTMAVLPLKSLTDPPSDIELRVGMADSIVTRLGSLSQLAVRPTSATIKYLDQKYDTTAVGKDLKVDSIIEGSVQKEGKKLKINLQMVSVADGRILWSDSFTNDLADVLNGQESVAGRVGRLVELNLGAASPEILAHPPTNLTAQELYLKGIYAMATATQRVENYLQARDYFEQSIRLDPNYALAYAGLAVTNTQVAELTILAPRETLPKAEAAARRALEIDPNVAMAHIALADFEVDYNWNWQAGEAEYLRALELSPNLARAHDAYSEFLARMGRFEEADYQSNLAQQLDPTFLNYQTIHSLSLIFAHRYDECIEINQAILARDPKMLLSWAYLSSVYSAKGNYAEALAAGEKAMALSGEAPGSLYVLGLAYARMNDEKKMNEVLAKLDSRSKVQYVDPAFAAAIYAWHGDNDKAFIYLGKCLKEKSYWITAIKVNPALDGLRSDPRFQVLLQKLAL